MPQQSIPNVAEEWPARYARLLAASSRLDPSGMTRPPRDADKREFLTRTGQLGPFVESAFVVRIGIAVDQPK